MAAPDYSFHSSPGSNNEAVESILSQAMEQIALEQIAALNTSHLSDAVLPTALESRFRKLKTLPTQEGPPAWVDHDKEQVPKSPIRSESRPTPPPVPVSSPPPQPAVAIPVTVSEKVSSKSRGGYVSSSPDSSPKGQVCCFGFSPKRDSRRRRKKKGKGDMGLKNGDGGDWMVDDELLLDSDTFSILKEQRRKMKKALEKQEKVSREAEKLVELVKHASARLDFSAIDEFLSDEEKFV